MAQKIIVELTEALRLTQKCRIQVLLDPAATPVQTDTANRALSKIADALTDAIIDDLQDGTPRVAKLTDKIKGNLQKIESELNGLKRTVALVKLAAELTKLGVQVMGIVA